VVHSSRDLGPPWTSVVDGVPVTTPARLAADLGAVVSFPRYEGAVDEMIARRLLTWDDALEALVVLARRGRNGIGPLRALLVERYGDEIAGSALERAFHRGLVEQGLPEPLLEYEIHDAAGFVARVDAAYPEALLAIELDSRLHHLTGHAFEEDRRKRNRLEVLTPPTGPSRFCARSRTRDVQERAQNRRAQRTPGGRRLSAGDRRWDAGPPGGRSRP
jgi:hypothetical protein